MVQVQSILRMMVKLVELPKGTIVSMNLWGYNKSILLEIEKGINSFFEIGLKENPLKCEYFIPAVCK